MGPPFIVGIRAGGASAATLQTAAYPYAATLGGLAWHPSRWTQPTCRTGASGSRAGRRGGGLEATNRNTSAPGYGAAAGPGAAQPQYRMVSPADTQASDPVAHPGRHCESVCRVALASPAAAGVDHRVKL